MQLLYAKLWLMFGCYLRRQTYDDQGPSGCLPRWRSVSREMAAEESGIGGQLRSSGGKKTIKEMDQSLVASLVKDIKEEGSQLHDFQVVKMTRHFLRTNRQRLFTFTTFRYVKGKQPPLR
ncbi:hypothetical protein HU200_044599 [Digitaria exilis]|uniref:Uncharacterized protein n=1 Tax=Digitaria exilis TaxID=1010633 RepID=A0A835B139_9POAL|nr:hypothetical protein HU200_044599 [Digitaria exilis]